MATFYQAQANGNTLTWMKGQYTETNELTQPYHVEKFEGRILGAEETCQALGLSDVIEAAKAKAQPQKS